MAKADLWVHGHTHDSFDYGLGRCRVVCNPRGYPPSWRAGRYENPAFDPAKIVEIGAAAQDGMNTKAMKTAEGLWLLVPSTLLPGLGRSALFVIAIAPGYQHVRAWGFWCEGSTGVRWIGPRHTNYPDGSICAFDVSARPNHLAEVRFWCKRSAEPPC